MRKIITILCFVILLSGCATTVRYGHAPNDYSPDVVELENIDTKKTGYAVVVGAEGDRQWGFLITAKPRITIRLDKPRNAFISFFSDGLSESIKVPAGTHDLVIHYEELSVGMTIQAKQVRLLADRTYLVNYREANRYITIWIEDTKTGEVVYGKKPAPEKIE